MASQAITLHVSRRRREWLYPKQCSECDASYVSQLPHKMTCSDPCKKKRARRKAMLKRMRLRDTDLDKTCSMCAISFRARRVHALFCSSRCANYAHHLKKQHGMTPDDYRVMVEKASGACSACGKPGDKLVVDHCHKTGSVRGLIHPHCNTALGYLNDDPELAEALSWYLRRAVI